MRWWCNEYDCHMLNINYTRGLKEFLIENPPTFSISDKCCKGAKKDVSKAYIRDNNIDLSITGCCGCPYGKNFEKELKIIQQYEPNLYSAVNNIFGQSYEYTRKFLEYRKK